MDSTRGVESSPTQFNYYAAAKTTACSVALLVLSAGAMKGIQQHIKWTITPLQRNALGVVLTAIYFVVTARIFGPLITKTEPPPSPPSPEGPSTEVALQGDASSSSPRSPAQLPEDPAEGAVQGCPLPLATEVDRQGDASTLSPRSSTQLSEDADVVVVARPDQHIATQPAEYSESIHGVNGSRMKQKLFTSLFGEYACLLKEKSLTDPTAKLVELERVSYWRRSQADHLLMWTLHYLLRPGSQSRFRATVSGDEARYWDFIQAHQALMKDYQGKEGTYSKNVLLWSRAIAEVRMTPSIQSYQETLIKAHYVSLPPMTAKTFHQAFSMRNEGIRNADPQMKLWSVWSNTAKLQGAVSLCDYFGVNPPNLRKVETWTDLQGGSRKILYLRHSTPHSGAAVTKAPIDLTYREFLRSAKARGEGVIYAIHQRLGDYGVKFEQEGYRVQSILDLENEHSNFIPLVQSVENDLFKKGRGTFGELKEAILDSFRQKSGARRNQLPKFLVNDQGASFQIKDQYEAKLREILNFVQETFFPRDGDSIEQDLVDYYGLLTDPAHMTHESQAFIMLFYHFQREHLKFADLTQYGYQHTVKFVNTGCKDDFDRGGAQNCVTDRVHQHIVHGANVPQEDLEATLSSIQAPPIQGKGIPAIKYRLHPALFVSSILANLTPSQMEALRAFRSNAWSLQSYDVGCRGGQSAI